ncbi:MAG: type IX secretion system membrane protein PorP/SprF [bacterium]
MKLKIHRKIIKVLGILSVLFLISPPVWCAFKDSGWGARPAGMGGAFTAVADDVNSILYNPAGIGQLERPEGSFMYSRLYTGLSAVKLGLNYFAYAHPMDNGGAWGISWANFIANGLYREDTATINYAHDLDVYQQVNADIYIGGNIKFLRNGYTLDDRTRSDPVFAKGRYSSALAVDLGVLANFESESVGFSVKMLNEPDIGLLETDRIPREYKLGFCYLFGDIWLLTEALAAVDLTYRDDDLNVHLGWENFFFDKVMGLRLGGNTRELTLGLGYLFDTGDFGIQIDYAFIWPLEILETTGSHRVSLLCRFGTPKKDKKSTPAE